MQLSQTLQLFGAIVLVFSLTNCEKKNIKTEDANCKLIDIQTKSASPNFDFSNHETGNHLSIDYRVSKEVGYEQGQTSYYEHISMFPETDSVAIIMHTTTSTDIDVHFLMTTEMDTIGEVRVNHILQTATFNDIGPNLANPLWDFVKQCVEDTPLWITITVGAFIVALECVAEYYDILPEPE